MPIEFRFDDLDLREDPAGARAESTDYSGPPARQTEADFTTTQNTRTCCV